MYKPNFCAECGARIERARWRWWTNRRFCPTCAQRFRRGHITRPLLAGLLLCGLGFSAGRALRPAAPPLVIANGALLALAPRGGETIAATHTATTSANNAPPPLVVYGPDGTANERPTDPNEIVSICGARTKKGTPCQRRVRGTGRCYQHLGKPALLPPEKLIIQGQ